MNISAANISPIVRLPTANDEQRQTFDRGRADDSRNDFSDNQRARPESTDYVFRGEILEPVESDKRYNPQLNQQIDPQNRQAISNYQITSVSRTETESLGQLIDRFI
jgi:hypothetical protein